MEQAINVLPPPYRQIYKKLMAGKVIPFLGAGASLGSRNPQTTPFLTEEDTITYLPTASELAEYLAREASLPASERGELTKMAQYFASAVGPLPLYESLRSIFACNQSPTPLHHFLAEIPAPLLIVTTNYDDLIERAHQEHGKAYDVIVHKSEGNTVLWWSHGAAEPKDIETEKLVDNLRLDEVTVIYKIHGAVDRREGEVGQYVITEDDYIEFLTNMTTRSVIPTIFAEPFQTRPFLFLGYGLYDWNLRVVLNRLQYFRRYPRFRSWAIESRVKLVERKVWEARGIDVYDGLTLDRFLENLKAQAPSLNAGGE